MINENDVLKFKKEKLKQDFIRRERLNELLLIHPSKRDSDDEQNLLELLVDFPCFQYCAEDNFEKFIEMTKYIYMECVLPNTVVVK